MSTEIDFDELVGGEFDFYGINGQCFDLDGLVYEVCEDGSILLINDRQGFHELPIARVAVEHSTFNDEGYELIDLHDGHCWLRFGMEYDWDMESGDVVFDYSPKSTDGL